MKIVLYVVVWLLINILLTLIVACASKLELHDSTTIKILVLSVIFNVFVVLGACLLWEQIREYYNRRKRVIRVSWWGKIHRKMKRNKR